MDNVFDNTIEIEELLHSDFMTEGLLNNILGGVALYSLSNDGNKLNVLKANEFYYSITKNYPKNVTAGGYDGLENLHPDDREKAIKAFPYRSEMYSVKMLYGCRLKFSTLQAVKIVQFIMRLFRTAVNKWAF